MRKFCVTIVRTGVVFVEAETPEEAMDIADHQTTDTVNWSEDWSPTDAEEQPDYDGLCLTERAFN